jgi:hypothetical protein
LLREVQFERKESCKWSRRNTPSLRVSDPTE